MDKLTWPAGSYAEEEGPAEEEGGARGAAGEDAGAPAGAVLGCTLIGVPCPFTLNKCSPLQNVFQPSARSA